MKKFLSSAMATSIAAAAVITVLATTTASALTFTNLTLVNNWVAYSATVYTPAVAIDSKGVVHLRGGIRQTVAGSSLAFTLPATFRPNKRIYAQTNLVGTTPGRLVIDPNGEVRVDADGALANAQNFTSLEVNFAR